jgi:hypothetical protein
VFAAAKIDPPTDKAMERISAGGEAATPVPIYFMDSMQIAAQDDRVRQKLQQAATTVLDRLRG